MDRSSHLLRNLLGHLTLILVFFILTRIPQDADMWWHLRAGQEMWEQKTILLTDQFSYTRPGEPWTNAFWLSEIAFYLLHRTGGFFAISLFVALLGGATFLLIYPRLSGNPFLNTIVILLAAITAAPIWGPRPQIISFFLLAWLDKWLLENESGKNRPLWILLPLFAIWANLHGGWIWGFLLLSAHIAGAIMRLSSKASIPAGSTGHAWRNIRNITLWTALGGLAVGLNPNGLSIWALPFQTLDVSLQIQEWLSPNFHRIDFHPMLWMIFLLLITGRFAGSRPDWTELFKVIGFAYLTFISQRNIGPFAIVAAPVLSDWANSAVETLNKSRASFRSMRLNKPLPSGTAGILNFIIIGSLSAFAFLRVYSMSMLEAVNEAVPSEAVAWIRQNHPQPRLFNSYNWGGYLIWALPEYPVFIDGRADLYGDELISEWRQIVNGTETGLNLLDHRNINLVLLEPGRPLLKELQLRGWELLYTDEKSVVYGR